MSIFSLHAPGEKRTNSWLTDVIQISSWCLASRGISLFWNTTGRRRILHLRRVCQSPQGECRDHLFLSLLLSLSMFLFLISPLSSLSLLPNYAELRNCETCKDVILQSDCSFKRHCWKLLKTFHAMIFRTCSNRLWSPKIRLCIKKNFCIKKSNETGRRYWRIQMIHCTLPPAQRKIRAVVHKFQTKAF